MRRHRSVWSEVACGSRMAWAMALAALSFGCTSAADIHTIKSPTAHFERYHSIAFDTGESPPKAYSASPQSADVWTHVKEATAHVLGDRGYVVATPDQADLVLRIEVGRRETTAPLTSPVGLSPTYPGYVPDYLPVVPPYHGYFDQEGQELVEGALIIDAFEGKTHELLWHGFVRAVVRPGQVDYDHLRRDVESMLASFPAPAPH